jgi:hypothetical protein
MKKIIVVLLALTLLACNSGSNTSNVNSGITSSGENANEPSLENDYEVLEKELRCTEFINTDKPPILLVHGTFTAGWEQ